ncbi:LysR family transcriptional regulator [Luteococcus peritonei]|uniref:LysR family transcriptional regulator n=1 Tax=Luteococcus peritonei TaxID=88874 RepID=A0ABW4RSR5_9ACTN
MFSPTVSQLQAFVAAHEEGSLSAGARRLGISQASISEAVQRLEENLNVVLFVRQPRGLLPTPAADALLPHVRVCLGALEAGSEAVRSLNALEGGVVSFGMLRYASSYGLSDLAQRFHARHPQVRIRMVGVNSHLVAQAVRQGSLEAGIVVLPVDSEGLTVTPIARDEVLLGSASRGPEQGPVGIEELVSMPLVLFDADAGPDDPTRRQLTERALRRGHVIEPLVEVELADTAAQLVATGVGASLFARTLAERPGFPGSIHLTPLDPPLHDTLAVVTRSDVYLSTATLRFAQMAEAAIRAHFEQSGRTDWQVS